MVKAIIFDLQGTLVENGVYPSPVKQVRYILGIMQSFHEYVPEFEKVFMTKCYDSLSEGFKEVAAHFDLEPPEYVIEKLVGVWNKNKLLSKVFPETIDVLTELKKDHKLILVANIDCFSKDIIEKYSLGQYFDHIFLSCDTGFLKTDPRLFEMVLEKSGLDKKDALMVGDSMESDIKSAEEAGITAVLVDRNNRMAYGRRISNLIGIKDYLGE
jgi:HAD superfamily hydrolase (TIGR01493 family)